MKLARRTKKGEGGRKGMFNIDLYHIRTNPRPRSIFSFPLRKNTSIRFIEGSFQSVDLLCMAVGIHDFGLRGFL